MTESYYHGDTIELSFQLYKDASVGELWDLTDCEIRFQLTGKENTLKRATPNVSGGSNGQILILNAIKGLFLVRVSKEESKELTIGVYAFEIEITTPEGKRFTVFKGSINLVKDAIDWEII